MSNPEVDQAVKRLRAEILAGKFGIGCLPFREDMAREYETSVYVINQTIKRLRDEGLLILKNKHVFIGQTGTSWEAARRASFQASITALEERRQAAKASEPVIIPTSLGELPFYVYTLSYPEGFVTSSGQELGGAVFYVGKGTVQPPSQIQRVDVHEWEVLRPSSNQPIFSINQYTINAIRHIWKQGKAVVKQIIFESASEGEAYTYERRALEQFASPYLTNHQQNPFVHQRILHGPAE